ncbi:MAG TPA: formate dehydrogenase accessory sulfurtransferase FdhD [Arenimonas sp.]|uniref:formate dehydrogenase accessory sulfurtransferase FdhD n=1 Tax=Arenimonas sp. TaxID=1872635 RepID=UPI002D7FF23F|nr:formate dehydrogenase accessory sulfurtransferase FdhD [Arenimonas sp.]HEU0152399.1 formate dehydrogenase accessory sulfurtransferase FdhD [Arenimonas sp.]
MSRAHVDVRTLRTDAGVGCEAIESLAEETPVALLYNGHPHAVMMATPSDLEDFAIGFSLSEGIVDVPADVRVVDIVHGADGISLQMHVPQRAFDALPGRDRSLVGRTGCGLCGSETLAQAIRPVPRVEGLPVAGDRLRDLFLALQARQPLNALTGAVHAAGVVDAYGQLHVREDVGRHNAIDKAIGAVLRRGARPRELLVTSRASYEVVHKAATVGIGLVAAISAPTALAVRLAQLAGLTLVGFARDERHTLYAGPGQDFL